MEAGVVSFRQNKLQGRDFGTLFARDKQTRRVKVSFARDELTRHGRGRREGKEGGRGGVGVGAKNKLTP